MIQELLELFIVFTIINCLLCILLKFRFASKREDRNQTPDLYVICINYRQKYNVNYDVIKNHGKFFWFEGNASQIDENIQSKTITFTMIKGISKILDKQKQHKKVCILMFSNVTKPFRISWFLDKQGNMVSISGNDVPAYLGSDEEWCFACPADIVPAAIFGEVKGKNIRFKIDEDFDVHKDVSIRKRKAGREDKNRKNWKQRKLSFRSRK